MRRALLFCFLCLSLFGQTKNDPWTPSTSYNSAIPTVQSVLGYKAGAKFTAYSNLERYYQAVAAVSDRMKLESYGSTYEGHKQYLITISSPKNLARLAEIRSAMERLGDPRKTTPAEAQAIAEKEPVVVWLGYGVHGNEANSAEAAMQVVYELTASQDPRVRQWLDNCVVLIDPLTNPDGHERYVQFYNSVAGEHPVADRFAAEQQERWPSGRTNLYFFDLNRDWAWQSQRETRNRLKVYLAWHPQVAADLHEMGSRSTYFFAPPAEPFFDPLRANLAKWYEIFGRGIATAFDRYGFRYYTHEGYDLFAPTYGDSWPALNGAIGMTFEMAGGGSGVALNLEDNERTLTLGDRAVRHFTSSLATIDTAVNHRVDRLRSFYDFHQAAITAGQQSKSREIFLLPGSDPSRIAHLVAILLGQGIEVQRLDSPVTIEDAAGYWSEKISDRKQAPVGAYVVDLAQPSGFLAQAVLEREVHLTTSDTYDITGWTLPLAMDVEAYAGHATGLHAAAVTEAPKLQGSVGGPQEASAYLIDWSQGNAAVLTNHLLQEDFKAYVSMQPFKENGKQFSAGTVIIPAETNPPALAERIRQLAQSDGCKVEAVSSQLNESGVDLGSPQVRFLRKPRVAVVMDAPINSNDYGAIWHLFEQRLGVPFTPIRAESFNNVDLHQYNVIILPGEAPLDPKRMEEWVKAGGVLIGIRGGAIYATKKKSGLTSVTYKFLERGAEEARIEQERMKKDENAKPEDAPPPPSAEEKKKEQEAKLARKLMKYADREKQERDSQVPGTIMRAEVDNTHPLGFGLGERLAVLDRTSPVLELTEKGENPVYFPKDGIKLSGYISAENEKKLAQTAYAVRERNGRGYVVLFADSPVFRGFWDGSARLLINAVFFGNVSDPRLP